MSNKNKSTAKTDALRAQREAKHAARAPDAPNGASSEGADKPKKAKRPLAILIASTLQRCVKRAGKARGRIEKWAGEEPKPIAAAIVAAETALGQAVEALIALPADYAPKPKKADKGEDKGKLQPGNIVAVREKYRASYADMLEAKELDDLTVVAAQGSRVIVRVSGNGDRLRFHRRELEVKPEQPDVPTSNATA